MSAGTVVERYGATVTTVDIPNKVVEFALKTGVTRRLTLATYPTSFNWPQVGDQIMVVYENGQWTLEGGFDTEGKYQAVNPGDTVIGSGTGTVHVTGAFGDWTLSPTTWPIDTTAGGALRGYYPNPDLTPVSSSAWVTPALSAGYVAANDPVSYLKDPLGFVHFKGRFSTLGGLGAMAFALPVGYRPGNNDDLYAAAGWTGSAVTSAFVDIQANGNFFVYFASGATSVGIGGISYLAEN